MLCDSIRYTNGLIPNASAVPKFTVALILCSAVGCGTPDARVTIDNTSPSTMVVQVDGKTMAKVEPGEFQRIHLAPGKYQFDVKVKGNSIFQGMRIIEGTDSAMFAKNYLFNPLGSRGYAVCKVVYGSSAFSDMANSAVTTFVEYQTGKKVDPVANKYHQVMKYAMPMKSNTWFEIPGSTGYILHDPPEVAYSRSGASTKRALTRISMAERDQLKNLHRVKQPTADQLATLMSVTTRALDSLAQLEKL